MVSPYVLLLGVTALVTAGLGAVTWRHRSEPGATALGVLLLGVLFWCGTYALALSTRGEAVRVTMEQVTWVGAAVTPVAWFVFVLAYTGYGEWVTRRSVAALSVPAVVVLALVWTNQYHGLVWVDYDYQVAQGVAVLSRQFGVAYWLFVVYAYTLVAAAIVLLLRLVFTAEHLFVDQGVALLVGVLFPVLAHLLSMTSLAPVDGIEVTPHAFAVSTVAVGYALHRSDVLDRIPATRRIGRTAAVRNMRDGVVVLDGDDTVVDVNRVACRQFDTDRSGAVGTPVEAVVGDDEFTLPDEECIFVWSGDGPREFEIQLSGVSDQHDRPVGRVLVVRDITDRANRRQQLAVLNRVLRHNFRNDLNVVDVCATQLQDRLDGEEAELADRIRRTARELTAKGTKAREIERIMSRRAKEPQPVDLPALVARQIDTLRHEYPEVRVETEMPPALEIESSGVIETAIQNVLENAVVHNDSERPQVTVRVGTVGDDEVAIAVADDGPGIPEQEREVLVKGTETPLEHGSGLGLWLVNWAVSMLGGEVTFTDNDPRGSVVTLRVPRSPTDIGGDVTVDPLSADGGYRD